MIRREWGGYMEEDKLYRQGGIPRVISGLKKTCEEGTIINTEYSEFVLGCEEEADRCMERYEWDTTNEFTPEQKEEVRVAL
jgi:hypothetical protein